MIKINSISKYYGDYKAVDQVSLEIREGEIVGLLGVNGAGKSTILKILGCFLLPTAGKATINGHSVVEEPEKVRECIGYLPDVAPLYNEMSVNDYLNFAVRLRASEATDYKNCVEEVLEKVGLAQVKNKRIQDLSHGFRQRVGIAQALVHKPKVLILDEPINGLDPIQIAEMRDLILSLKGRHTVIVSSHILSEITRTCDRILVINDGALVAEGSEEELRHGSSGSMSCQLEFKGDIDKILNALDACGDVKILEHKSTESSHILNLEMLKDKRSEIAKIVVSSKGDLLHLAKKEAELEALFFKLIAGENKK